MNMSNIAVTTLSRKLYKQKQIRLMSDIQRAHIRRLDMTQLLVFEGLMRLRKLTLVAEEIGLTQSAVSHIVKRLRENFDDELFLRRPSGVEPTSRALALEPMIGEIVALSSRALQLDKDFDPQTEIRTIKIAGPDFQMALYSPLIISLFTQKAQGLRLSFTSQTRDDALVSLSAGQIDIAIGFFWKLPDHFEKQSLYSESYQIVMRRGHPLASEEMDTDTYCAAQHLLVSVRGDLEGIVDTTLANLGKSRHVKASVAQFFPALTTTSTSDLICTIPSRLAQRYCDQFNLVSKTVPFAIRPFGVSAVWHRRTSSDLALAWVRAQLVGLID
jgi:DNA-binding transcriptional LysR family regulator